MLSVLQELHVFISKHRNFVNLTVPNNWLVSTFFRKQNSYSFQVTGLIPFMNDAEDSILFPTSHIFAVIPIFRKKTGEAFKFKTDCLQNCCSEFFIRNSEESFIGGTKSYRTFSPTFIVKVETLRWKRRRNYSHYFPKNKCFLRKNYRLNRASNWKLVTPIKLIKKYAIGLVSSVWINRVWKRKKTFNQFYFSRYSEK